MTTATAQAPAAIDTQKAEEFGGYVVGVINGAALAYTISVGHRTGLFDTMAGLPPSTCAQIAGEAGLNERYVREWLGAATTGRIVEHDGIAGTYWLPAEHAASLTRAAGPGNLATMTQFFPLLGQVEDGIVESFQKGGGVPYAQFETFQQVMGGWSSAVFDATLIDVTLPLVPGLVEKLRAGIDVADVGCGIGHGINVMAQAFPNSRFVGYDFSDEGIGIARDEAKALDLTNARFEVKDAATLSGPPAFDLITTFDAVHDQANPRRMLKGIYDALRPGGTYLCVDIGADSTHAGNMDHPLAPFLYTVSTFHCMTVSLALGGEGLGTCWGEQQARELLAEAGFGQVEIAKVDGDVLNNYYVARKG